MNRELKEYGETVAGIFLETMPEDIRTRYMTKKLHHQLAFFFCWCEEMQEEMRDEA